MKGLPWGEYYVRYGRLRDLDPNLLDARIVDLMADEDATCKKGVYLYLLDGDERHLSIRLFDRRTVRAAYERQGRRCAHLRDGMRVERMHGDHIVPWSKGGHTTSDNCQMLCRDCNPRKGAGSVRARHTPQACSGVWAPDVGRRFSMAPYSVHCPNLPKHARTAAFQKVRNRWNSAVSGRTSGI